MRLLSDGIDSRAENWEYYKQWVRMKAIGSGRIIHFEARIDEKSLRQRVEKLLRVGADRSETSTEDVTDIRQKFEVIDRV